MPGPSFSTDAFVLGKRPPADRFQTLTIFSASHGAQFVLQRISLKTPQKTAALDLFDEATFLLESSPRGPGVFIKEAHLLTRRADIGRNYESLLYASRLASLVSRNAVAEESRSAVYALVKQTLEAFAQSARPDIVYLKSLYIFARDEGYPIKQQWFPTLPADDRASLAVLLNQPLAVQIISSQVVAHLLERLEHYLRTHTEILLEDRS